MKDKPVFNLRTVDLQSILSHRSNLAARRPRVRKHLYAAMELPELVVELPQVNMGLIEPSEDGISNHGYSVAIRLSRFEIDFVDSIAHVFSLTDLINCRKRMDNEGQKGTIHAPSLDDNSLELVTFGTTAKAGLSSVEWLKHLRSGSNKRLGQEWIRTTEGVSQQIYSLPRLATSVPTRNTLPATRFEFRVRSQ